MKQPKKTSNEKWSDFASVLALVVMSGLAFEGVKSLVDAKPSIQTAIAVLLVLLLVKTAVKK